MHTQFLTIDTALYTIKNLETVVNQWHKKHDFYHRNHAIPGMRMSLYDCIRSTSVGPDYFTITYACNFSADETP